MESPHPTNTNSNDTSRNTSEGFGKIPNASETFGTIPNDAERFGSLRNGSEKTDNHTLTVRDVAKMFEQADVPRTERSIINWCQPNRQGIARLDAFYDANERKYFITPESTTRAIQEEQAKQQSSGATQPPASKNIPNGSEGSKKENHFPKDSESPEEIAEMRATMRGLEITNKVKDQFIGMLEKDRERMAGERDNYVRNLMNQSHRIGQLETKLLQLGAPLSELGGDESYVESSTSVKVPVDHSDSSPSFSLKED